MKPNRLFRSLLISSVCLIAVPDQASATWLNAYSPGDGIQGFGVRRLDTGNYYIVAKKDSLPFAAKVDAHGKLKWAKSLLAPLKVQTASLTTGSTFHLMYSSPEFFEPFVWGQITLKESNGAVHPVYAKKFAKPLVDSSLSLVQSNDRNSDVPGYTIQGSVNSSNRNGPDQTNNDVFIAKVNAGNGSLAWNRIYGFDLGSGIPFASDSPPFVTQHGDSMYFSRTMNLETTGDPSFLTWTVLAKLNGTTGALVGSPLMFDGLVGVHNVLADGTVYLQGSLLDPTTSEQSSYLIKFDSNLNLIWAKRYAPPTGTTYSSGLFVVNRLEDGNWGLGGNHTEYDFSTFTFRASPIAVKINPADGSIVSQTEMRMRTRDHLTLQPTVMPKVAPSGSNILRGATDNAVDAQMRDIVFGNLDQDFGVNWIKSLNGAAIANPAQGYSLLQIHSAAGGFYGWGMTNLGKPGSDNLLLGELAADGSIAQCSMLQDESPSFVPPLWWRKILTSVRFFTPLTS